MPRDWERLEDLFTQACELPTQARAEFVARYCMGDQALRDELTALLRARDSASGFLDHLQLKAGGEADQPSFTLGSRFGPWCVVRALGRGGMGEVYEVARADGTFEQRAALKLLRHEAAAQIERFHAERDILARLDHPGIARLLDGGVADDGRPWAVLEYVEGETITSWCTTHNADLSKRLNLFEQVCEAVAYAHRNLIVHRDLKPSNILVDSSGRVRLLDFGIAKLIDPSLGSSGETTQMPLTPDYCAPEQLAGEPVTTATDTYSLGLLLYELLTGEKAWSIQGLPIARAIRTLIEANAPKPSVTALTQANSPVPARLLRGDLDAIVARCLRKEPALRYATVDALAQDIERHQQGRTVAARGGARMYVFGRFLRRYKWAVAGVAAIILALAAGIAATAWQAKRAEAQATRAEAVKNFLIDVFDASNPVVASDKPRGSITARELLDASAMKIEKAFAAQPEVQIELLGIAGDIYRDLGEEQRYFSLRGQHMDAVRRYYGELHPTYIHDVMESVKYPRTKEEKTILLAKADELIIRAGLDDSPERARWWELKARATNNDADMEAALLKAVSLYERTDTSDSAYVHVLINLAGIYSRRDSYGLAREMFLRAKAVNSGRHNNDVDGALIESNLASIAESTGDSAAAVQGFEQAAELCRRSLGESNPNCWSYFANWENSASDTGDLASARRAFELWKKAVPVSASHERSIGYKRALVRHGSYLLKSGRIPEAIATLEAARNLYAADKQASFDAHRTNQQLGTAYAKSGRNNEARIALKAAVDGYGGLVSANNSRLLGARTSWGRFLFNQGEVDAAEEQFIEVLSKDRERNTSLTPFALAGIALVNLHRGDPAAALKASNEALLSYSSIQSGRTVRAEPYIWRVHARTLAANGDLTNARDYAQRALDAFSLYDDPASPEIADSKTVLAEIDRFAKK